MDFRAVLQFSPPHWSASHYRTFSWWPQLPRCAHLGPRSRTHVQGTRMIVHLAIFYIIKWRSHNKDPKTILDCGTHEVDGAKAAMADLFQVCEEFFRVLLEEELSNLGVFQAPRANSVGHAGSGLGLGRSHQGLSGSATQQPPARAHLQDNGLIRIHTYAHKNKRNFLLILKNWKPTCHKRSSMMLTSIIIIN